MKITPVSSHRRHMRTLAALIATVLSTPLLAQAETHILVGTDTYVPFSTGLAAGSAVYLNADNNPINTDIRATQRSLGYREVDYKAQFSALLNFSQVTPTESGGNTLYDYSSQANKNTDLVGFWKSKDLPIIIGPDGKAYITDGHHTTAGYLAADSFTPPRSILPGEEHVVLGHVVQNLYTGPATQPDDAWWQARQSANNAFLYGTVGNQLAQPTDPGGNSGLQPILPSVLPMPTVPGTASMTNDSYRSLTWGLADGITNGNKGFSKTNSLSTATPQPDINFVEFYWADFLRNRIMWDDTKTGHALGSGQSDANLISAPISFFAAVANGTALAKSEIYKDQYGRTLNDYNNASFGDNTQTWAGASLKNGLAKTTNTYDMYLLDDSTVKGDITPSAKSTNHLHIDTTTGQTIDGKIQNFASVDINKGASVNATWKDTVLQPQNSTLTIAPGTGTVVFTNENNYSGTTNVGAGTLVVADGGSISNSSAVTINSGATLINNGSVGIATGTVDVFGKIGGSGVFNAPVTIETGASLSPGNSPGILTFASGLSLKDGSFLDFDIGALSDKILITAGLFQKTAGGNGITVNLNKGSGFAYGTYYELIDWSGASLSGIDASIFHAGLPSGQMASFRIVGNKLESAVILPAPPTLWLFGIGLAGMGAFSRRARKQ